MPDDRPINVLFINDHLGFDGGAWHGVTRYFMNVLPKFDRSRFSVSACFLRGRHAAADVLEAAGIDLTFLDRRAFDIRTFADLLKLIERKHADILHLSGMGSLLFGRLAARRTGLPVVLHFHEESIDPWWVALAQRRVARWTDRAFSVSDGVGAWCGRKFGVPPDKIETLPNGIPIEQFDVDRDAARHRIRNEFKIAPTAPIITIIGRLSWEKGHGILLDALPRLREEFDGLTLLIVGEGPTREELIDACKTAGTTESVRFCGSRPDIPEILAASDVCAMPSFIEGFPFVMLETLAAGVPLVASKVGGLAENLSHEKTAMLVPPKEPNALAEALGRVLREPELAAKLTDQGRRFVQRFSVENHVDRLQTVYRSFVQSQDAHTPADSVERSQPAAGET